MSIINKYCLNFFVITMVLLSCVEAGSYRKYDNSFATTILNMGTNPGGYKDYRISDNEFKVTYIAGDDDYGWFVENSRNNIRSHALHRASDLTKNQGFRYFVVTNELWKKTDGTPIVSGPYISQRKIDVVIMNIQCFRSQPSQGGYCVR